MRKFLLALALAVTLSNMTLGVIYACKCTGTGGATCCGADCYKFSDGGCMCSGACPKSFAEEVVVLSQ